ncbi:MAG: dihydroorotase [Gammaproteobacteria bacterium]|nr:dihydroorotase [Gammaproteobacteria bacterium]
MNVLIKNGRIIDPANNIDEMNDLYIADGIIAAIGSPPADFVVEQKIEASGLVVCPGLVDLAAHLREPGEEHKATIASETKAAVKGGITTLCCPPNTTPVIDTTAVVELIHHKAELSGRTHIHPLGAMSKKLEGQKLSNMAALKNAGCVGISNHWFPLKNTLVLRRALEYAATYDLTVFLYPEDHHLRNDGCVHEGIVSTRLGLPGIPEAAETAALAQQLILIKETGVRAHFCRLSSAQAVTMIADAQQAGLTVTADVAAHQLQLCEIDLSDFDSHCHVRPPLRTQRDQQGLNNGLVNRVISAICSDHQPHEADAKLKPFSDTEPGIAGLETLLPLSLRLFHEQRLSLPELLSKITSEPARILQISAGTLAIQSAADICIFDPDHYWEITPESWLSQGYNTPFIGWELKGHVTHTFIDGKLVYQYQP